MIAPAENLQPALRLYAMRARARQAKEEAERQAKEEVDRQARKLQCPTSERQPSDTPPRTPCGGKVTADILGGGYPSGGDVATPEKMPRPEDEGSAENSLEGSPEYPALKKALQAPPGESSTFPQVFAEGVYKGGYEQAVATLDAGVAKPENQLHGATTAAAAAAAVVAEQTKLAADVASPLRQRVREAEETTAAAAAAPAEDAEAKEAAVVARVNAEKLAAELEAHVQRNKFLEAHITRLKRAPVASELAQKVAAALAQQAAHSESPQSFHEERKSLHACVLSLMSLLEEESKSADELADALEKEKQKNEEQQRDMKLMKEKHQRLAELALSDTGKLRAERDMLRQRLRDFREEFVQLTAAMDALGAEHAQALESLADLRPQVAEARRSAKDATASAQECERRLVGAQADNENLRQDIEAMQAEIYKLRRLRRQLEGALATDATSTRAAEEVQDRVYVFSAPGIHSEPAAVPVAVEAADGAVPCECAPPKKRIEKANRPWVAEDASQLGVAEGEFVDIWVDIGIEHGWIHAGRRGGDGESGWLPTCVLEVNEAGKRWMCATQEWKAMDPFQCSIENGAVALIWAGTRTPEGWTYAEVRDPDGANHPGWLPVFCFDWYED